MLTYYANILNTTLTKYIRNTTFTNITFYNSTPPRARARLAGSPAQGPGQIRTLIDTY